MKRIGFIALAVILSLGLVGTGLAYWNETLEIGQNTVNTGELKMEFKYPSSDDGPGKNDVKEYKYGSPIRWDVDVGSCQIEVIDKHTTRVTLSNVYPGYQSRIKLGMWNTGSIPAEIESVTLKNIVDHDGLLDYVKVGGRINLQWGPTSYHHKPVGYEPPQWGVPLAGFDELLFKALKSTQTEPLEPGWKVSFECEDPEEGSSLCFYIKEGAPEDATLTFDLVFDWTQFNAT